MTWITPIAVGCLLCAAPLGCCGNRVKGHEDAGMSEPRPGNAPEAIDRYVAEQEGWTRDQYRIDRSRNEGGYVVYVVVFLLDETEPAIGGGKSFEVFWDPVKNRIDHVLRFQ